MSVAVEQATWFEKQRLLARRGRRQDSDVPEYRGKIVTHTDDLRDAGFLAKLLLSYRDEIDHAWKVARRLEAENIALKGGAR